MKRGVIALVCLAVLAGLFAASPASAACGVAGGRTALTSGTPVVGDVDNGQIDKYSFTVPAGAAGYVALQMFNGDIDIVVCNSSNVELCNSHNFMGFHDGCHASELSLPLPSPPWDPDTYLVEWGDALPPGTYRLDVKHCFSSEDEGLCDYAATDPILGEPLAPGALDDAPPVQYALLFRTQ